MRGSIYDREEKVGRVKKGKEKINAWVGKGEWCGLPAKSGVVIGE